MTPLVILLWFGNLVCDTTGQLAFKAASERAGEAEGFRRWKTMLSGPFLWLGIGAFVAEPLMWLAFLSMVPLAQGVMLGSVNIIGVMIGGRILFGEALTTKRILAIALITFGVALVGWGGEA